MSRIKCDSRLMLKQCRNVFSSNKFGVQQPVKVRSLCRAAGVAFKHFGRNIRTCPHSIWHASPKKKSNRKKIYMIDEWDGSRPESTSGRSHLQVRSSNKKKTGLALFRNVQFRFIRTAKLINRAGLQAHMPNYFIGHFCPENMYICDEQKPVARCWFL